MPVQSIELSELEDGESGQPPLLDDNMEMIKDVKVNIRVMIGEAEILVGDLFNLSKDSVVKLDREVMAPVDLILNDRVIAQGKLVAADDNFGVQITQIMP